MTDTVTAKPHGLLDQEVTALRDQVLKISFLVEKAIEQAIQSLKNQDVELARGIIADDAEINRLRYDLEKKCYLLFATQQPTARDMRSIVTAIHVAVELERMGDHAEGIAKLSLELAKEPMLKPLIDVPRMAQIGTEMMRASLNAYLTWDETLARQTIDRDAEVNELDTQVYRELLTYMLQDPHNISRATYLLWVSHNLERIADRVTNICERVLFMITGEVVESGDEEN
jgi:phosphate transport system protein